MHTSINKESLVQKKPSNNDFTSINNESLIHAEKKTMIITRSISCNEEFKYT
jgi:hypothetical protein